jgi:NhaA family Na+:H+ antiporter
MTVIANETVSVADRVQHVLHPITSFAVVPIFALANAGVAISAGAFDAEGASTVAAGIAVGLLVGKVVGIAGASALAVRLRLAKLPEGATWSQLVGVATVAGIGFTVSLFITGLAFDTADLQDAARIAVLGASAAASVAGVALLARAGRSAPPDAPSVAPGS